MAWHQLTKRTLRCSWLLHSNSAKHAKQVAQSWFRPFHVSVANNMAAGQLNVSGIFPPIPTPFNENEDIDYGELKSNLSKWNKIPFAGE